MSSVFHGYVTKDELPFDKCEDHFEELIQDQGIRIIAMSDGAGTAGFSRQWATALTNWVIKNPPREFSESVVAEWLQNSMDDLNKEWLHQIGPYEDLPYYGQNKLEEGSQATLLLLRLEENRFSALAVGDTCLFQIRAEELIRSFPLHKAEEFNTSPGLIHTSLGILPQKGDSLHVLSESCQPGDYFVLATDALSKWLLAQHEQGSPAWNPLLNLKEDKDLKTLVKKLVTKKEMRNDDVAVWIYCVTGSQKGKKVEPEQETSKSAFSIIEKTEVLVDVSVEPDSVELRLESTQALNPNAPTIPDGSHLNSGSENISAS